MDINKMTRKQFEELPYIDEMNGIDVDSIVLLPSKRHHDSGFNVYEVVICNKWTALGKCFGYDTFSIFMQGDYNRVGIDCLRGSGLMRIFLPPNEYYADPTFHQIKKKRDDRDFLYKIKDIENTIQGKNLMPMWYKWKETLIDEYKGELKMLNEEKIREIKLKKKQGALNSILMKEYDITYAQLKSILEEGEKNNG